MADVTAEQVQNAIATIDHEADGWEYGTPEYERIADARRTLEALAAELAECRGERDAWKAEANLLTHKVITCGVAASHPDADLSRKGAYGSKWDSPQAEAVRSLRARAESAEAALARGRACQRFELDAPGTISGPYDDGQIMLASDVLAAIDHQGGDGEEVK